MSTAAVVTVVSIVAFLVLMASLFFSDGHPVARDERR